MHTFRKGNVRSEDPVEKMSRCLIKSSEHGRFCIFSKIKLPGKKEELWDGYNVNKKPSSNEDFKKLKSKGILQKECPSWVLTSNIEMKTFSKDFKKQAAHIWACFRSLSLQLFVGSYGFPSFACWV